MTVDQFDQTYRLSHGIAEAFSTQSKFCNRISLALIAASAVVLFPESVDNHVKLPFSLGSVPSDTFKTVGFAILVVLIMSHNQAYASTHIAVRLANEVFAKFDSKDKGSMDKGSMDKSSIHPRNLFDLLVTPNFARVSPLPQLTSSPRIGAVYYFFLKLVALTVIFLIPIIAVISAYVQLINSPTLGTWAFTVSSLALIIASISVIHLLYIEFAHMFRVTKLFWSGKLTRQIN